MRNAPSAPGRDDTEQVPIRDGVRLRDGGRDVWLVPWTRRPWERGPRAEDSGDTRDGPGEVWWTEHAPTVLHRLASDAYNIEQLRRLLGQTHWLGSTERLRDHEVVDRIRREVESGWLVFADLRHRERERVAAAPRQKPPAAEPAPPSPAPAPRRPAPTPAAPVVVEDNPLDAIDQDRQADTLRRAAEDGAPFCEECEKAKKQQQAAAA